jgi:hypothetical protein
VGLGFIFQDSGSKSLLGLQNHRVCHLGKSGGKRSRVRGFGIRVWG